MGFSIDVSIPAATVFLQGILSFFSPCVLPLVPLYIGYLAGGTNTVDENGSICYPRKKVIANTLFFIAGVSFAFFLLGFGFTAAGRFFSGNRTLFARIGGILVILFGLFQLGVFGSNILEKERRLPFQLSRLAMNPAVALVMGFTFSFAWTPCVGPALASVLLMASSASTMSSGFFLIGVYTIGFVLPFLAVGFFTSAVLGFFRKYNRVVKYTVKAGGALMVLMGIMMLTGWMNGITGYLSSFGGGTAGPSSSQAETAASEEPGGGTAGDEEKIPAPDFTLTDQFGESHTLSDYKGKTVFLNFWATWCGPCRSEMPDIQKLYEAYGLNGEDLIVLGVANPKTADAPYNQDEKLETVVQFLDDNGYSYPTVMDTSGETFSAYGISAIPTTFMIDRDGNVFGYITGPMTMSIMEDIVRQTMEGKRTS